MSLDYARAMQGLYGDEILRGESWYEDVDEAGTDEDEGIDECDNEEYDSDDEY